MKKKMSIVTSSIAVIAVSASLIAGSTYALFTSESNVDISVTAGNVQLEASVANVETYSRGEKQESSVTEEGAVKYNFENGGFASVSGNKLSLNAVTPMDSVEFDLVVSNSSTVTVQYRTVISYTEDTGLFEALSISIDETEYAGGAVYTNWNTLKVGETLNPVHVAIALPEEVGNEYKNKTCTLTYFVEAVQYNADVSNYIYNTDIPVAVTESGEQIKFTNNENLKSILATLGSKEEYSGAVLNLPTNGKVDCGGAHVNLTRSLTINGNNATLYNGGDLSVETYASFKEDINLNIYNLNNIYVWGERSSTNANLTNHVLNVYMENCRNENYRLVYITSNANSNIIQNVTLKNCVASGYDSMAYFNSAGSLKLDGCVFNSVNVPVNMNTKAATGKLTVDIENCIFNDCATDVAQAEGYNGVIRYVRTGLNSEVVANVTNCKFNYSEGKSAICGDILLGDSRSAGKPCYSLTLNYKGATAVLQQLNGEQATRQTITDNVTVNHTGWEG